MCAVDQKRPFFPRAGPFLDLLPFKGLFSLTGALTGPPYGKAPYGEASYGKAGPLQESPLRGGTVLTGRAGVPYGSFTEKDDEEAYGKAGPLREAPYEEGRSLREGPVPHGRAGVPYRSLREGPGFLYGSFTEKDDEEAYGKAGPLREAPYEEERSLREGPVLTGRGGFLREGPLRITGKLTGSYGEGLYQNWAGISACAP